MRSQHWRTVENSAAYLEPELRPGRSVLDVGCGPGTITVDMADRVAPGHVLGVDPSAEVLELARRNAADRDRLVFAQGDATALPAPTNSFDIVHAHQVLLHLTDPVAALREMLRVAKPDGVVAVRDTDYAGAFWWPADPRLDRWLAIYRAVAHANGAEPDGGRHLLAWANAAGAVDVRPGASIWCHSTPADRAWWGGMWSERILRSKIADQAVAGGFATRAELEDISAAWREWSQHPDGWLALPHGELLCRPPR